MLPMDLKTTFLVVDPGLSVHPVPVGPTLYQDLEARFQGFRQCLLVAVHWFDRDWPTWERHPMGDEILVLLSGRAELRLWEGGSARTLPFDRPGTSVIIPRGTWHTASIEGECRILFITPGEGTVNAAHPGEGQG
ncbi:hypothetical protein GETHPA_01080 [Geothrix rubra]|uniref:Cupin type-2 domain-containing protein n=1 Tax=Geothrix rubra TaxID=2927977 RepID=A0ABQ5Q1F8_9BACT|nr:cupin domain-containing protein [Geothrix rubra]GLH68575.1 hypothetical protein GETHPA_01080 [Geothrix rubra]